MRIGFADLSTGDVASNTVRLEKRGLQCRIASRKISCNPWLYGVFEFHRTSREEGYRHFPFEMKSGDAEEPDGISQPHGIHEGSCNIPPRLAVLLVDGRAGDHCSIYAKHISAVKWR
jgi:hypothetical protein